MGAEPTVHTLKPGDRMTYRQELPIRYVLEMGDGTTLEFTLTANQTLTMTAGTGGTGPVLVNLHPVEEQLGELRSVPLD